MAMTPAPNSTAIAAHPRPAFDVRPDSRKSVMNAAASSTQAASVASEADLRRSAMAARKTKAQAKPAMATHPKACHCQACGSSRHGGALLHESSHVRPNPKVVPNSAPKPLAAAMPHASSTAPARFATLVLSTARAFPQRAGSSADDRARYSGPARGVFLNVGRFRTTPRSALNRQTHSTKSRGDAPVEFVLDASGPKSASKLTALVGVRRTVHKRGHEPRQQAR